VGLDPPRRRHDVSAVAGTEGGSGCSPSTTSARHSSTGFGPLPGGPAQPAARRSAIWGSGGTPGLEADPGAGNGNPCRSDDRQSRAHDIGRTSVAARHDTGTRLARPPPAWTGGMSRRAWRHATADLGECVGCINLAGESVGHEQVRRSERLFDDGLSGPRNGKSKEQRSSERCHGSD